MILHAVVMEPLTLHPPTNRDEARQDLTGSDPQRVNKREVP